MAIQQTFIQILYLPYHDECIILGIDFGFSIFAGYAFSYANIQGNLSIKEVTKQKEKNHALQVLAGSIAHEMRNPLGQLRHNLNTMEHQLPPYQPSQTEIQLPTKSLNQLYQGMAQSQMAVKRGIQVIDMIMDQVHEKPIDPTTFVYLDAAQITQKALDEYGYDSDTERQRVHFFATSSFNVRIDETLYLFVLFNLLKNALYYLSAYDRR